MRGGGESTWGRTSSYDPSGSAGSQGQARWRGTHFRDQGKRKGNQGGSDTEREERGEHRLQGSRRVCLERLDGIRFEVTSLQPTEACKAPERRPLKSAGGGERGAESETRAQGRARVLRTREREAENRKPGAGTRRAGTRGAGTGGARSMERGRRRSEPREMSGRGMGSGLTVRALTARTHRSNLRCPPAR